MTAGRRDLERALGLLLPFHFAEIDIVKICRAKGRAEIDGRRLQRTQSFEEFERLAQALDPEHCRALADDAGLGGIFARQHHARELRRAREQRGRQRTLDALDAPVEREFAQHQVSAQARAILQYVLRGKNSERERKIERRAFLARVGRREVDRHLARREIEAGIFERRLDAIERLLDRALGQPDQAMRRNAGADINLDFDWKCVNANQRAGYYACVQEYLLLLTDC